LQWEKNTAVELTFMVKAFTQNGGSYWVLMNFYCRKMLFSFSYTDHDQNSIYGDMPYLAKQRIGFGQLTWDKEINNHDLLLGLPSVTNITMTTLPQQ
jgi:hypothetical protein